MERYDHERALPPLEDVLAELEAGHLEYFEGKENRDGKRYRNVQLWGPDGSTVTGLHRIIAASTLGRWVDREAQVDHMNHDPSDNRAENLEIVTASQNQARRRQPLDVLRAVDPNKVKKQTSRVKKQTSRRTIKNQQAKTQAAIERYLAMTNRYIGQTPHGTSAAATPTAARSLVIAPPLAKTGQKTTPDEQSLQKARDAFAAKYAHRRK
jgi:hypothetical protein